MADQTPPGPKTSGRIAGVIAVVALILGGYYGVIARSAPPADGDAAKTEAAKTEAAPPGVAAEAEIANEEAAGAGSAEPGAAASAAADAKSGETGDAAAPQASAPAKDAAGAAPEAKVAADGAASQPDAPDGAASAEASGPSFDIVRVEPTGEAVVAGLAEPNAKVELLDGAGPIAEGVANERGEWAIVVEKPLPPGTHDLSIRTTSPDGKTQALSEQRVAVAVPEPGKGEALVVLNEPDAPSRVLQLPDGSEPAAGAGTAQMAANEPQAAADGTGTGTAEGAAPLADAAGAGSSAADANAGAAGTDMAAKDMAAKDAAANDMAAKAAGDAAPGQTADAADAGASADAAAPGSATAPGTDKAAGTDTATASGEAPAGADAAVAATTPQPAASGDAATTAQTGDATAGAAGEAAAPGAVADAGTAADGTAAATGDSAPANVAEATQAEPQPQPKVTVDAVEFENGRIYIAGSSATGGTVRIYVDGIAVGDVESGQDGRWLLESQRELTPGRHTVRADQVNKATGEVIVRAEVPFDQQVDVAILSPVITEGGGAEGASGGGTMPGPLNVIIRRGDNLWTISRRLYGKGIRYSTIYEANADQIRNPHLIYPGQIFMLPAGDTRWTN